MLAVPGGAWATLLTRSVVYTPVKALIDIKYPDPLFSDLRRDGAGALRLLRRRPT